MSVTNPTGIEIINKMNERFGLIGSFVHGEPTNMVVATTFNNSGNLYALTVDDIFNGSFIPESGNGLDNRTNIDYPSINYSISCTVTPFDDYNPKNWYTGKRNMGEGSTVMNQSGDAAFLGNTRYGIVGDSKDLFNGFIDLIKTGGANLHLGVAEHISKRNHIGTIDTIAIEGVIHIFDNGQYLKLSHNLIGCPETMMWTSAPSQFTNVVIDNTGNISVNAGVNG